MRLKRLGLALSLAVALVPAAAQAYTYKVIHDFCSKRSCEDGSQPEAGLIMDAAGTLYGMTEGSSGGSIRGVAYALVPNGDRSHWKLHTLHLFHFDASPEGYSPSGPLILDTAGNLYGTNNEGGSGAHPGGTAFELLANGGFGRRAVQVLTAFDFTDGKGSGPFGGLVYQGQASGALYDGTSPLFGTAAVGDDIYRLTPSGGTWTHDPLYRFCSLNHCADGDGSSTPLVDAGGNLLGTASDGGPAGHGLVYRLAESGGVWGETVLHGFCTQPRCRDGARPFSGVIGDALGNLYGTTLSGGRHTELGVGTAFKLEPDGSYSVLYKFCSLGDCRDGADVFDGLVMDGSGMLFGVTRGGGGNDQDANHAGGGTVYSLSGTTLQTLYRFCTQRKCHDGAYPVGQLLVDAGGNLFGVTQAGGKYGAGVAFELSP